MGQAAGRQPPAIDRLDAVTRKKCLDLLLSGAPGSVGKVAEIAGVSRQVVTKYKQLHLGPAVRTAAKILQSQQVAESPTAQVAQTSELAKQVIAASPFRDRLEFLWRTTEDGLERAKKAVRVVTDRETGELVSAGADVTAIAPLLNQAHKNLEILGQVTGELQATVPAAGNSTFVLVPIAVPQLPAALPQPAQDVEWTEVPSTPDASCDRTDV